MVSGRAISRRRRTLSLLAVFLLLAFLIGMIAAEAARGKTAIRKETVTRTVVTEQKTLTGYVFADEVPLVASGDGAVEYLAHSGDRVGAGETVAHTFTDKENDRKRERAAALYEKIGALGSALERGEEPWQKTYGVLFGETVTALAKGDLAAGGKTASALAALLERGSAESAGDASRATIEEALASCRAELDRLLDFEEKTAVSAPFDGIFVDLADGLEARFTRDAARTVTPETLREMLAAEPSREDLIGKVVRGESFYMAVPLSSADAAYFGIGSAYRVRFATGGAVTMIVERVVGSENEKEALLLLRGDELPQAFDFARRQCVTVELERYTGLCVPLAALYNDGDRSYLFVDREGKAEKRFVEIYYSHAGVCLVSPCGEGESLTEGDRVLVTARRIYEGKAVS